MRKRDRGRFGAALASSVVVHAAVILLFWATGSRAAQLPEMRVYAVDIVSPPPRAAGDPAEGTPEPDDAVEPAEEEREPDPPPEPEPSPPAPTTSEPEPEDDPEDREPEAEKSPAPREPEPSRGRDPDPESEGGEGLDVRIRGAQCPSAAYCDNIIRQLNRYFRPPTAASRDQAEVFFYINRDGTVDGVRVTEASGSFQFRLAALEAVEQAGRSRAFGTLPSSFQLDRLPVSFYFRPTR
jgi:outer membrane biosynthesis protein TonB